MAGEKKEGAKVEFSAKEAKTEDRTCLVRVYVVGTDNKKPIASNITMTFYVRNAKVSEVAKRAAAALS